MHEEGWFNSDMDNAHTRIEKLIHWLCTGETRNVKHIHSQEDQESSEEGDLAQMRMFMRDQFLQMQKRGLSLKIMTV